MSTQEGFDAECAKFVLATVKDYHEKASASGWATTGISFDAELLTSAAAHFDRLTATLTTYQSLGSPEYLAALVEVCEAVGLVRYADLERDGQEAVTAAYDALSAAHDNAERLREEGL